MADSRPQTIQQINDTFIDQQFLSQADFEKKLEQFSKATYSVFRKRDSKPCKSNAPGFQYRRLRYECIHFGKPRMTFTIDGSRPNQKTNALDCKCTFTVQFFDKNEESPNHLKIIIHNLEHNHPTSKAVFDTYAKNRQLTDEQIKFCLPMIKGKSAVHDIRRALEDKFDKTVLKQDVHNIRFKMRQAKRSGRSESDMLPESFKNEAVWWLKETPPLNTEESSKSSDSFPSYGFDQCDHLEVPSQHVEQSVSQLASTESKAGVGIRKYKLTNTERYNLCKPSIDLFVSYLTNSKHVCDDDFYALLGTFNDFVSALTTDTADQETVEIEATAPKTSASLGVSVPPRAAQQLTEVLPSLAEVIEPEPLTKNTRGRKPYTEEQKPEAAKKRNEKRTDEKQQLSKQTASKRAHIDDSSDLVFE